MYGVPHPRKPLWRRVVFGVVVAIFSLVVVVVVNTALVFGGFAFLMSAGDGPMPRTTSPEPGLYTAQFTDLGSPRSVAVGLDGAVYVISGFTASGLVLKLDFASDDQIELPFDDLNDPQGIAVGSDGAVYVGDTRDDGTGRVLRWVPGTGAALELPFGELGSVAAVTLGRDDAVYVAEAAREQPGTGRVLMLTQASTQPTVLPIEGLNSPQGLAVYGAWGVVFVADRYGDTVLRFSPDTLETEAVDVGDCGPTGLGGAGSYSVLLSCFDGTVLSVEFGEYARPVEVLLDDLGHAFGVAGEQRDLYVSTYGDDTGRVVNLIS